MTDALTEISSKSSPSEIEKFFNGPEVTRYKQQICEVGRRMWRRGYVDGNGGNLAIRVASDLVLCTPTLVSKGFMKPEDLCLVDLNGAQMAGDQRRTSEILMHLEIMKCQPRAVATVHGHPPYGTAYGLAGIVPPTGRISEYELFVSTALAPYRTPGTPDLGREVAALVDRHNTILMANHGVVAWSHTSVEDAYFKLEILEAYCQTLCIAAQLGRPLSEISPAQVKDLLAIKARFGIPDPRITG